MFTVVIVDDHPLIHEVIRTRLERTGEFRVPIACTDGRSGWAATRELRPDLLIIDLDIPLLSGIEVIRHLRQEGVSVAILVVTASDDLAVGVQVWRAGANGLVHKRAASDDLVTAAQRVVRGQTFFGAVLAMAPPPDAVPPDGPLRTLGARELEVFRGLAQGHANVVIARDLGISHKTVSSHKRKVMDKLGLANIRELIDLARRHGISG